LKMELARLGFPDARYDEKQDAMLVNPSDERVMRIMNDGEIFYYGEHDPIVYSQLRPMSEKINEILAAWEKAPCIPIEGISHFRILSEHNNVVLAARNDSYEDFGYVFTFVTWKYAHNRTGFEHGNYTTDYEAAKEDFAFRAGLVDRHKMMSETELKLIHQGLVFLGANAPDLSVDAMTNVGKLIEKVEMIVPEIQERSVYEEHDLVAEDGLEV